MTILAAEAGDALAARATATPRAFRSRSGTAPPRSATAGRFPAERTAGVQPRSGGRTQQGSPRPARRMNRPPRTRQVRATVTDMGRTRTPRSPRSYVPTNLGGPDVGNYEMAVLAEFVVAVLLVSATPFARKDKQGLSPYEGQDMIQILALGLLYFLLALIAAGGGGKARVAAWMGGLILLVVGLAEAATLVKLFKGGTAPGSGTSGAAAPTYTGGADLGQAVTGVVGAIENLPPSSISALGQGA